MDKLLEQNPNLQPTMIDNMGPSTESFKDLKLTQTEYHQIISAMKRPKFQDLLGDYMDEISDPANKDEYDEYLHQMKREGDLPKGMKLIRPDAVFCIKTTIVAKTDKGQIQKLFVNVCSTDFLARPTFEVDQQRGGQQWKLPYTAGKVRYDQTADKTVCCTVDAAFHPYAFQLAHQNSNFHELLCKTVLDGAKIQLGERKDNVSNDYKVMKNMKCKGGKPALLTIGTGPGKQSESAKRQGGEGQSTSLQRDIMAQKEAFNEDKIKEEQETKKKLEEEIENIKEQEMIDQKDTHGETGSIPVQVPKYKIIHSYPVEYADFLENSSSNNGRKKPSAINVDIFLPRVQAFKEIESLDINEKSLVLDVPKKYFLDVKIPYQVIQEEGSAKFDAKKHILKIKLPINTKFLPTDEEIDQKLREIRGQNDKFDEEEKFFKKQQKELEDNKENGEKNEKEKLAEKMQKYDDSMKEIQKQQKESNGNLEEMGKTEENLEKKQENTEEKIEDNEQKQENEENNDKPPKIQEIDEDDRDQQIEEAENENKENYLEVQEGVNLNFVREQETEANIDINIEEEEQEKPQIEEIEIVEEIPVPEVELTQSEKQKIIFDYKTQETDGNFFIIVNIPNYEKHNVGYVIFQNQVLLSYENKKQCHYLRVLLDKEINEDQSKVNMVTDFVVVQLVKQEQIFWEQNFLNKQEDDFEQFSNMFQQVSEAKNIFTEAKRSEEAQIKKAQNKLDALDDDSDGEEENNEESNQKSEKEGEDTNKEEVIDDTKSQQSEQELKKINDKQNIIQFIEFDTNNVAFSIC